MRFEGKGFFNLNEDLYENIFRIQTRTTLKNSGEKIATWLYQNQRVNGPASQLSGYAELVPGKVVTLERRKVFNLEGETHAQRRRTQSCGFKDGKLAYQARAQRLSRSSPVDDFQALMNQTYSDLETWHEQKAHIFCDIPITPND